MSTADQLRQAAEKRKATAIARAALAGIVVHDLVGDDGRPEFVATKWAMTRSFRDVAELERWLDRVAGAA